jgi:putative nucleotidyltransferase with HDIG domain
MPTAISASSETKIKQVIASIRNLPTPPIVFAQIQKVINNPDTSVTDIASILSEDPAMSVKVLKLTNSAFYGLSREIDSIKHAVMIIGLEAVKNLVLSASVLNMFKASDSNREYHEGFWRHSLATAFAARLIAKKFKSGRVFNPDPAFSAGLVHDIGKMVICCFMGKEHQLIMEYLKAQTELTDMNAEQAILNYDHAGLGRQLAVNWKLPSRLADSIGYHHQPQVTNMSDDFAYLISFADHIALVGLPVGSVERKRPEINPPTAEFFGVQPTDIEEYKTALFEEYMKAETFMRIAAS